MLRGIEEQAGAARARLSRLGPVQATEEHLIGRLLAEHVIDTAQVADLLGVQMGTVATYASRAEGRYVDFPAPIATYNSGHCRLYLRIAIEAWQERHPGRQP